MIFASFLTEGHTAVRRSTFVDLGAHQLRILDEQGKLIDEWSYTGLRFIDTLYRGQSVRLSHCDHDKACLTVEDQRFLPLLRGTIPCLRGQRRIQRGTSARLLCCSIAVIVMGLGLFWWGPRLADPLARMVPMRWEEPLGWYLTESFVQHAPVCNGAAGQAALKVLTERLLPTTLSQMPLKFQVRKAHVINAFALPGGQVMMFHGLVKAARSPEEVAGVLAHEMAHQIQRHPMRGLVRSMGLRMISGTVMGGFSMTIASGTRVGETLFSLSYNREDELEADRVGVELLNNADIRGDGLIDFFMRYQGGTAMTVSRAKKGESTQEHLMTFLSTHPPGQERLTTIRSMVRGKRDALTTEQWKALQTICDGIDEK